MMTNTLKRGLVATTAAGVLGAGLIVPALAQDSDTPTDSTEEATEDTSHQERHAARDAAFAAALADELGLDEATVADAIDVVRDQLRTQAQAERLAALEERLSEAVEAGDLTQEQADALRDAAEAGVLPFGRGGHGLRGPGFGPRGPMMEAPSTDDATVEETTATA